jgi:hypothetical protein
VSIEFGFGGHHCTYVGAGAGEQALQGALEALALGRAEVVLAVGCDTLSRALYEALAAEGALDNAVLGEGACALVLETAAHAEARGAQGVPFPGKLPDGGAVRAQLGLTGAAEGFFAVAGAVSTTGVLHMTVL